MPTLISTKQFLSVLFTCFLYNSLFLLSTFAQNETVNLDTGFSIEVCEDNSIFSSNQLDQNCFKEIVLSELNKKEYKDRIWLKITIKDANKEFIDFNKNIDSIKVYHNQDLFLTGSLVAQSEKQLPLSIAISAIKIPVYNQPFYIEIISSQKYPISTQLEVLNEKNFNRIYVKERRNTVDFQLFFQGMLWIILLYNFFLFLSSREKVYLAYAIYIFGFSLFTSQNAGLFVDYFSAQNPYFSLFFRMFGLAITAVGFFSFILTFLPKKVFNKFWKRFFSIGIIFSIGMLLPYIILNYGLGNSYLYDKTSKAAHGIILLCNLIFIGYLAKNYWSDTLVRYFLLGSACAMGGAFLSNVLKALFGDTLGDVYLVAQVGVILEILTFSLGLGYRMKNLEKENARILENQNKLLEQKVTERTKEISMKQEEILVQNEELHQQQEEIISQRDYIEKQNTQLKSANTQFTDSVRYAKTIQKAILPMKQRVQTHFEESFVLFRPRDIVSGDFYWVYETNDPITKEEIILIAVLDCTGHGVPGAFISLIGFALLNEIVSKELITKPAQIIARLDERLQEALRQKQSNNMDGMDVALCSIKKVDSIHHSTGKKQFEITFSGAKRPLYYIKDDIFEELKGNKMSVGGITKKKERVDVEFQEEKFILTKGDKIYLTTDGFVDQNGRNQQKIGSLKLKSSLEEFHTLPLSEQKTKLEEILDLHQGKQKQRDDITIMGVKL
ncbi:7TM diverse intracellular signaling domain-containing protein [Bernardetia sp. Wsw4-3y2]|uniref:7TM diverse intracellular signaling domain-containing protein n=1 Tax=Bernardetia sp. Wsw4-3y2 TaxID=3127471 RepID=UPI0030D530BF